MASWLVALCACASAPVARPPGELPTATARRVAPYASLATAFDGEPWRVDEARVVWGGLRFERLDGGLEVAGGFAAPVIAAVHSAGGWLFVTEDGLLARADAFLGPLQVVERSSAAGSVVPSLERIVIARGGTLWTSEGHPLVAPAGRRGGDSRATTAS